jgi:hypothetical protein
MAVEAVRASGIQSKVAEVLAKGVKSIDEHVFTKHSY